MTPPTLVMETKASEPRNLRKRKIDLNRLSSSVTCPQVCQFQYCGIQLKDGDSLEWHYQGHLAQELSRLDKIRVKKNPKDFPNRLTLRRVRKQAFERIQFRRESRQALPTPRRLTEGGLSIPPRPFRCPSCEQMVQADGESELSEEARLQEHLEACLRVAENVGIEDEEVDVDSADGFEEYEWAGQRRVRATALLDGGLRGAGFLTITPADDEDLELDVENDLEERTFGRAQYTEANIILPAADSVSEATERDALRTSIIGSPPQAHDNSPSEGDSSHPPDQRTELETVRQENETLKQISLCNVCMDVYSNPLVSVSCWHVHCEQCWLRALGAKKLCPRCKIIVKPEDLRKLYL